MHIYTLTRTVAGWGPPTQVTHENADDYLPNWSPDGSKFVFQRNADPQDPNLPPQPLNFDIYMIDAVQPQSATQLTFNPAFDTKPVWSPDGTTVLFQSNRTGDFDLYTRVLFPSPGDEFPLFVRPPSGVPGDSGMDRLADWAPLAGYATTARMPVRAVDPNSTPPNAPQPITVTFLGSVSPPGGFVTAVVIPSPSGVPFGFQIVGNAYDIVSGAGYTGGVQVCFEGAFRPGDQIYHGVGGTWETPPTTVSADGTACATLSSLSPIMVLRPADVTAPVTTATVTPAANAAGWYAAAVTVGLSASDEPGGSGVRDLTYRATGAGALAAVTVPGATASVPVSSEGATTVSFQASDQAGNVEVEHGVTLRLDLTAPVTTANITNTGTQATVTLTAFDALSGVAATTYEVNGGSTTAYAGPFTLTGSGTFTVTFRSTDVAGLVESTRSATVTLVGSSRTLCTTLGGTKLLDVDLFAFSAVAGERVKVTLAPDPLGSWVGGRAVLTLAGYKLLKVDDTVVPNLVSASVPVNGPYAVTVSETLSSSGRFSGAYCVTLESSGNAWQSFVRK